MNISYTRPASAPCLATSSSGDTPLPADFDITWPKRLTMPWLNRRVNGSLTSTMPASCSTLTKKRE